MRQREEMQIGNGIRGQKVSKQKWTEDGRRNRRGRDAKGNFEKVVGISKSYIEERLEE